MWWRYMLYCVPSACCHYGCCCCCCCYLEIICWLHSAVCYFQVYRGPTCTYRLTGLHPDTEYTVRVCGMRITGCDGDDVVGIPSVETALKTLPLRPANTHTAGTTDSSRAGTDSSVLLSRWTDQQYAIILLLVFAVCALLIAFLAQQIVMYSTSGADEAAVSLHDPQSHADVHHPHTH